MDVPDYGTALIALVFVLAGIVLNSYIGWKLINEVYEPYDL